MKRTVAENRRSAITRILEMNNQDIFDQDLRTAARKMMNSYYRLCGLCERNLYLANDERACNRKSTAESEERENRWYKRLDADFAKFGLELHYFGYFPSIVKRGTTQDAYITYFYN